MEDSQELQQMYQEREQRIEEAIQRAEQGTASEEDFDIIRVECGLKPSSKKLSKHSLEAAFDDFGNIKFQLLIIRK